MRFTSVFLTGVLAIMASAQTATDKGDSTPTNNLTPAQSSAAACVKQCKNGDVGCQSRCVNVPNPSDQQANDTTACAAKCPQGDGTEAQTKTYATCVDKCINDHFFNPKDGTPQGNGGSSDTKTTSAAAAASSAAGSVSSAAGSAVSSAVSAASSAASATGSGDAQSSGTATGTGASATQSDSGASSIVLGSAGFMGLIAAVLAL